MATSRAFFRAYSSSATEPAGACGRFVLEILQRSLTLRSLALGLREYLFLLLEGRVESCALIVQSLLEFRQLLRREARLEAFELLPQSRNVRTKLRGARPSTLDLRGKFFDVAGRLLVRGCTRERLAERTRTCFELTERFCQIVGAAFCLLSGLLLLFERRGPRLRIYGRVVGRCHIAVRLAEFALCFR